jgi:hypothetical protein
MVLSRLAEMWQQDDLRVRFAYLKENMYTINFRGSGEPGSWALVKQRLVSWLLLGSRY